MQILTPIHLSPNLSPRLTKGTEAVALIVAMETEAVVLIVAVTKVVEGLGADSEEGVEVSLMIKDLREFCNVIFVIKTVI